MEQLAHPAEAPRGGKVIALGSFDGVHLGHQALLRAALARARQLDLPLLVYTFDPPGRTFFSGEPLLSEREEKLELLEELGVDLALVARFDAEFAQRSAQEFLEDLRALEARWIYVGEDFRFGHRRQGGVEDLAQVAPVEPLPLLEWEGQPVKSSRIRALLQEARLDEVQALLGRPYTARGRVIPGDQRGRTLGYPTANLAVAKNKALPRGAFAVWVKAPQGRYKGMANVGVRPTVGGGELRLEVHLFDFEGLLYGEVLEVAFIALLRPEQRFASLDELRRQLARDAERARALLQ